MMGIISICFQLLEHSLKTLNKKQISEPLKKFDAILFQSTVDYQITRERKGLSEADTPKAVLGDIEQGRIPSS